LPPGFRVIDVRSLKVAKLAVPARFAALSYMWQQLKDSGHVQLERENVKELEVSGGLSNVPLPSIISDAMFLCRELGEMYLWVDRLCIIQDDTE
jgi:hypothetical protein